MTFASRNYAESFNFIQAHPMHPDVPEATDTPTIQVYPKFVRLLTAGIILMINATKIRRIRDKFGHLLDLRSARLKMNGKGETENGSY